MIRTRRYPANPRFRRALPALLLAAGTLRAATYQVGPGKPYENLQAVTQLLQGGDIVNVEGAVTYPGGVTLNAHDGPAIRIIGQKLAGNRPVLSGGVAVLRVLGSHYIIEGFDLTAGGDPRTARCFYNVGDDVTLRDCVIHDCRCTGVAGSDISGSLTLDRDEIFHCGNGLFAHQVYVGSSLSKYPQALFRMQFCYLHDGAGGNNLKSRVTRNQIEYNWIEGSAFHELDLVGPDPKAQTTPAGGIHCDADIIGNVFVKRASSAGTLARLGSDGTASSRGRYRFVNNTIIVESNTAAAFGLLWLKGEVDALSMWNNVFYSSAAPLKLVRSEITLAPKLTGSGNWLPAGAQNLPQSWGIIFGTNPGFVNESAGDYRPANPSPLIGAGALPPLIPRFTPPQHAALQGPPRPPARAKDIGAYFYLP